MEGRSTAERGCGQCQGIRGFGVRNSFLEEVGVEPTPSRPDADDAEGGPLVPLRTRMLHGGMGQIIVEGHWRPTLGRDGDGHVAALGRTLRATRGEGTQQTGLTCCAVAQRMVVANSVVRAHRGFWRRTGPLAARASIFGGAPLQHVTDTVAERNWSETTVGRVQHILNRAWFMLA